MALANCIELLSVYRQLFVPASKLSISFSAPRRSQHCISLSKHVLVLLKQLKVALFHVKQSPIEYPATMFATFHERLESLRGDHHDRQSPGQLGHRPHIFAIYPKAGMVQPLLDTD